MSKMHVIIRHFLNSDGDPQQEPVVAVQSRKEADTVCLKANAGAEALALWAKQERLVPVPPLNPNIYGNDIWKRYMPEWEFPWRITSWNLSEWEKPWTYTVVEVPVL